MSESTTTQAIQQLTILILSFHQHLGVPSGQFSSVSNKNVVYTSYPTDFIALVSGVAQEVQTLDYGLDERCSSPGSGNDGTFSLPNSVHTGSGAHPGSYQMANVRKAAGT